MLNLDCIESALSALGETGWSRARVRFLARFLCALFAAKTVNLTQIASVFPGEALIESHYKTIQRFFRFFEMNLDGIAHQVLTLAQRAGATAPFVLAIDRTEWQLGTTVFNVLTVALVFGKVAFPICWSLLDKAGASNAAERIALLQRALSLLGGERIAFVCADREFACYALLAWLRENQIGFRLRIKADTLIADEHGEMVCADWLFRKVALDQEWTPSAERARSCLGQSVFVTGTRITNDKGKIEYLIMVSDVAAPLSDYALRWSIENLFSAFKSRGFDLEKTHLSEAERLSKLLAILALAFSWAFALGQWHFQQREQAGTPIRPRCHGRLPISRFRSGLDRLRRLLCSLCGYTKQADLKLAVNLLSCT